MTPFDEQLQSLVMSYIAQFDDDGASREMAHVIYTLADMLAMVVVGATDGHKDGIAHYMKQIRPHLAERTRDMGKVLREAYLTIPTDALARQH